MDDLRADRTVARQLGFGPDEKLLLVHADDLGICHAANQAVFEVFEYGIVKSGSIMMPCPWVHEVAAWCREHPDGDIGIHLTLNSEWRTLRWGPVASSDKVKSLLDPDGCFWRLPGDTLAHAASEEIAIELRAQIEKALLIGLTPTHLDFHMGTMFLKPEWVEISLALSTEYGIPLTLACWSEDFGRREVASRGVPLEYMQSLLQTCSGRGLSSVDHFITAVDHDDVPARRDAYYKIIRNLTPGITQLVIHPGLDTAEMRAMMSGVGDGPGRRNADRQVFSEPETRALIEAEGIRLIGWKDLAPRLRQRNATAGT